MYKQNMSLRYIYYRWLLAFVLSGVLLAGSFYVPVTTTIAHACQANGGGC